MAKHTINGFIYYDKSRYSAKSEPTITFLPFKSESETWGVIVGPHSFEVEVPDNFDPRPQQIAALNAEKQRVRAEFAKAVRDIDERIQSLLAIENTAEAA